MNLFKKTLSSLISGSLILASFTGTVFAEESLTSDDTVSEAVTTTETFSEENGTLSLVTEISEESAVTVETTTAAPDTYSVFDIYDGHAEYISTTTDSSTENEITSTPFDKAHGIDVSKWQGEIDWNKVKEDNVEFAIVRAGYGKETYQEDPYFDINMQNAKAAGIDCGAYWFSYATTVEEAYQEAEVCYSVIKDYEFEYPIVFDIETDTQRNLSTATVSAIVEAFCSTLEEKGYYVSVYSYASFLNTKIYSSVLEKYDVWVAHFYVDQPEFNGSYGMWQYTDKGSVSGINEDVDLNYAYKNYPEIIISNNKNGY